HRLQSVANVGQSAANNHRQGIVEIRPLHLLFNVDGLHVEGAGAGRRLTVASVRRSEREFGILIVSHRSQFSVLSSQFSAKARVGLFELVWGRARRPSKRRSKAAPALS